MGRKAIKKERPSLFPEDKTENDAIIQKRLIMGALVRIGQPSSRYFQYIHHSLNFINSKLSDLNKLLELEGEKARVTGLVQMTSGEELAIISKKDGRPFHHNFHKLFVDREKALQNGEIINLD